MKQLTLIKFLSAATLVCAADVPITQDELVRRTQELYDALVSGNQAPWRVRRMTQVFDLNDPAHPKHIRDFGLPGVPGAKPRGRSAFSLFPDAVGYDSLAACRRLPIYPSCREPISKLGCWSFSARYRN